MFNVMEQRKKQIDTLRAFNDKVETISEGEKYEIKFKSGRNKVSLIIELDNEFPYSTPNISVIPNLIHPWIEQENKVKSAPGILNFTINSDLGRVCQAIIREFEKNPPELAANTQPIVIQSTIPEILSLQVDQLQALLNDDQYLDDFIEELSPIKALNSDLDALIESNENLANKNFEMKSQLDQLKSKIGALSTEFAGMAEMYDGVNRRYIAKSQEYSPDHIKELLEIAVTNAEFECEKYVENFLNGDDTLTQFLDNFMETKKLITTRKFKEERLNFQLNQLKL